MVGHQKNSLEPFYNLSEGIIWAFWRSEKQTILNDILFSNDIQIRELTQPTSCDFSACFRFWGSDCPINYSRKWRHGMSAFFCHYISQLKSQKQSHDRMLWFCLQKTKYAQGVYIPSLVCIARLPLLAKDCRSDYGMFNNFLKASNLLPKQ